MAGDIISFGASNVLAYISTQSERAEILGELRDEFFPFTTEYQYQCDDLTMILENVRGKIFHVSESFLEHQVPRSFRYAAIIDEFYCKLYIVQDEGEDAMWLLFLKPIDEIIEG